MNNDYMIMIIMIIIKLYLKDGPSYLWCKINQSFIYYESKSFLQIYLHLLINQIFLRLIWNQTELISVWCVVMREA